MRLTRWVALFLLLMGLCLSSLSPAQAADRPGSDSAATAAGDTGDSGLLDGDTGDTGEAESPEALPLIEPGDPATPEQKEAALDTLEEVQEALAPVTAATEEQPASSSEDGRSATMALRDLSLQAGALPPAKRNPAYAEFQRPWDYGAPNTRRECANAIVGSTTVPLCVHWRVGQTSQSYALDMLETLKAVATRYLRAGYRAPKQDAPRTTGDFGGGRQTDVYLTPMSDGRYGYTTVDVTDNGRFAYPPARGRSDMPAFMVLGNNFTPQVMQVTVAHEYYHAVQFGYDYGEDRWFMEATATWAEDQVYPAVNDNRQYLAFSQLTRPSTSLDDFSGARGFLPYGDWIFFQYLSQRAPGSTGGMPSIVLSMWQLADSVSGPDYYSTRAIAVALARRHLDFARTFTQYAAANRHPRLTYADASPRYPVGRPAKRVGLRPGKGSASGSVRVNHLASKTIRFVPKQMPRKRVKLRIDVDMAARGTGSRAIVTITTKAGRVTNRMVKLGKRGNGHLVTSFSSRRVANVELTLVNTNRSYKRCWVAGTDFACQGEPVRDGMLEKWRVKVRR